MATPEKILPNLNFGNLKSPSFALRPSNGLKSLRPSLIFGNGFNDLSLFLNYSDGVNASFALSITEPKPPFNFSNPAFASSAPLPTAP